MLKQISSAAFVAASFVAPVQAETHTITAGYAYQEVKHFNHFAGFNLKYRYEFTHRYGLMSSFGFISGSDPYETKTEVARSKNNLKVKTLSLLTGPVYRIDRHVSLYGLVGVNRGKVSDYPLRDDGRRGHRVRDNDARAQWRTSSFAWGGGLQINPIDYIAIDLGYEGTRARVDGKKYTMSGFNIGVGYSF